jgi:hypothetical protein
MKRSWKTPNFPGSLLSVILKKSNAPPTRQVSLPS